MRKKDILELKRRFKKDQCSFTKMIGCFVNEDKHIMLQFNETFLNLEEEEFHKYLNIATKVLSGTIGNNILELNFPADEGPVSEKQLSLIQLKKSELKDDRLLDDFFKSIIDNYDYTGNYLILVYHDVYDVITKTSDNLKIDESEEVYEYILCAICPVLLSEPGLRYYEEENTIKSRIRDWVVGAPTNGFVYPAFIERSPDVDAVMYYTKNAKEAHPELMEKALGCTPKETATIQKQKFQHIIKNSLGGDEEKSDEIYMDIQDNLNAMIDEHNSISDDLDTEPLTLTKKEIQNLLVDSGVPEEITTNIENIYEENFGEDLPLAESLIDKKIIRESEQRKKEKNLENQVEILQTKLEKATTDDLYYDVILKVRSEKVSQIKSEIIDGQKCIIIPVNEDEETKIDEL